jgi:hypothetical protein
MKKLVGIHSLYLHGAGPFTRLHCRGETRAVCVHSRRVADEFLVVHYCKAKPYDVVCVNWLSRPYMLFEA